MNTEINNVLLVCYKNSQTGHVKTYSWRGVYRNDGVTKSKEFSIKRCGYEAAWQKAVSFRLHGDENSLNVCPPVPEMPKHLRDYLDELSKSQYFNKKHPRPSGIILTPPFAIPSHFYRWTIEFIDKKTGERCRESVQINKYGYKTAWEMALKIMSEKSGNDMSEFIDRVPPCPDFIQDLNIQELGNPNDHLGDRTYRKTRISLTRTKTDLIFRFVGRSIGLPDKYFSIITNGYDEAWRKIREHRIAVCMDGVDVPLTPPPMSPETREHLDKLRSSIFIRHVPNQERGPSFYIYTSSGTRFFSIRRNGYEGAWVKAREVLLSIVGDNTGVPINPPPITQKIIDSLNVPLKKIGRPKAK